MSGNCTYLKLVTQILLFAILSGCFFWMCYRYDNKYQNSQPFGYGGSLSLEDAMLEKGVVFLTEGWELYRGRLMTPRDFMSAPPKPDEYITIGQYGGFEIGEQGPHGSATYRLTIALPETAADYILELPEIYSAFRLYLNGELVAGCGDPHEESYQAATMISRAGVRASNTLEILVAVADYTHFYSGMVYPPAFGRSQQMEIHLLIRYGIRFVWNILALCVGVYNLLVYYMLGRPGRRQNRVYRRFSLLCVLYVGYTCYPWLKTLPFPTLWWYPVEDSCYFLMLATVLLIERGAAWSGRKKRIFGAAVALQLAGIIAAYRLAPGNLKWMTAWSGWVDVCTWGCAVALSVYAVKSAARETAAGALLTGVVVFDSSLIADRVLVEYEPIYTGWFTEIAGGVLVACIGVMLAKETAVQYRIRWMLEERIHASGKMLRSQKGLYPLLLEQERQAHAARHDLRHHMVYIREMTASREIERLESYLNRYLKSYPRPLSLSFCRHYVVDILLRSFYHMACSHGVHAEIRAVAPQDMGFEEPDLCVVLGNLLENGIEASQRLPEDKRWISVAVRYQYSTLTIIMDNRFDGQAPEKTGWFLSSKEAGRRGVGLLSIRSVAEQYGGKASFYPDPVAGTFHSEILLQDRAEKEGIR